MRAVVFILLPWLLLLPLSWGLDLSSCGTSLRNRLSKEEESKINDGESCQGDWPENDTPKFNGLTGYVRRVADACLDKSNKTTWFGNKAAAECTLSTLYYEKCNPVPYSKEMSISHRQKPKGIVYPFELVCEYYKDKMGNKKVADKDIPSDCKKFHFECHQEFDKTINFTHSDCKLGYEGVNISSMQCPNPGNETLIIDFAKDVLAQCADRIEHFRVQRMRECLFNTAFENCNKDTEAIMKTVCNKLGNQSDFDCENFSKECFNTGLNLRGITTLKPTTPTTESTTSTTPSTTAKTTTASTTRELDSNETTTQPIGPSSSSEIPLTTSSATTRTIVETTPEPTTVATTTEPTTEPITEPTTVPTTVITTEAATTTTITSTTKSTTEPTTEAPTTTESITSPATTPTSGTNPPSTTATTSKSTKKQEPIAPPVQPLITTNPSEDATPIPESDLSDARQSGSQSRSQGAATDEEGTNLTPLYAVLGVLAVVLAVVGGIVALVIVRKRRNKKRNEGVESGLNTSTSVNLMGKKKPQPPKAPPAKAKVNAKVNNNTNKGSHKEANVENPDQMPAGSLDGFRREGRLVMDVGIHKGELVEHATKDDDGKEIGHVVIDPTLNYMVDIGDDVELVITEEGQEDGGGGEAAKDQKKSERKSAKEKQSEAKSAKEKSGAKSAAKSTAVT